MKDRIENARRLALLFGTAALAGVVFGEVIPPSRWELYRDKEVAFPRSMVAALDKYQREYRTADAKAAAELLRKVYSTGELRLSFELSELSSDALLPLGDGLLGALLEYDEAAVWQARQGGRASVPASEAELISRRSLKSLAVISTAAAAIGSKCDRKMLGILRRFHFTDRNGPQKDLDIAIEKITSGACSVQ